MRIRKINDNLEIIKKADSYYSFIVLPMYPPFEDCLFTKDLDVATIRAKDNYNRYSKW